MWSSIVCIERRTRKSRSLSLHCLNKATSAPFATLVYYKEKNFEKKLARRAFINTFLIEATL